MLPEAYNEVLERFAEHKDKIKELLENAEGVIYFDELNKIISMSIDGDMFSSALKDIFGVKSSAMEISINDEWDDYGGLFLSDFTNEERKKLIEQHYNKRY